MAPRTPYPPQAMAWLTGEGARVLVLGATPPLVRMLHGLGHHVTAVDRSLVALARLAELPDTVPVAATADRLPFAPMLFDVVLLPQNLHTFPHRELLSEVARVLVPQGRIALVYTTRDDTVPWVRRLAATMQAVDPTAMRGDYGTDAVAHVEASRYYPVLEQQSFRTWFPVQRDDLVAMVASRDATKRLDDATRERLLTDVAAHYDAMARPPEPLLLPYQATCWRARVAQEELTTPITLEDGLRIF